MTVIKFEADWCHPCKALAPIVREVVDIFKAQGHDIGTIAIDADQNPEIAAQYHVQSLPTLVFMDGSNELSRLVGMQPKNKLEAHLKALLLSY